MQDAQSNNYRSDGSYIMNTFTQVSWLFSMASTYQHLAGCH